MNTKQENPLQFNVVISLESTDLEARSVITEIKAQLSGLPYSYSKIECRIENYFYRTESGNTMKIDGGQADLALFFKEQEGYYEGNVSAVFRLFGPKEFYPLDRYLLNLSFTLPNFGLLTAANTMIRIYSSEDYGWGGADFDVMWDGDMAIISTHREFSRGGGGLSEVLVFTSFMIVLACCFLLLGSTTLIKPEKLEHRLTICLTLFIFSISYSSAMKVAGGYSLGETIINSLLFGTALFAVISIFEKALIDINPKLNVSYYFLDGVFLILTAWSLTTAGNLGWFADQLKIYPWLATPMTVNSVLSGFLAIFVIGPYVTKTSIFVAHSLWKNRTRIKQRVKFPR